METINQLITALRILIGVGGVCRIIAILVQNIGEEDKRPAYKQIKNIIIFMIFSVVILSIRDIIKSYYFIRSL